MNVIRRPTQACSEPIAEGRSIELPFFGIANSGKTYLVTAAVHGIRLMAAQLGRGVLVNGATKANEAIAEYEKILFDSSPQDWLSLPMTDLFAYAYLSDADDGESRAMIWEPAEYSLMLQHPHRASKGHGESACLRLYDHPGMCHWESGGITPSLYDVCDRATAVCLVVDLTCEPEVASMCCDDTRVRAAGDSVPTRHGHPWFLDFQERQLAFANWCIRQVRLGNLARDKARPLFVVLSKFDQWGSLILDSHLPSPSRIDHDSSLIELDLGIVRAISDRCSGLIHTYCPQLARALAQVGDECPLVFIPCTATGHGATLLDGRVHHRVSDIKPAWAEVPLLLAFSEAPGSYVVRIGAELWR